MNKKGLELFSVMISMFTLVVLVTAGYFLIFEPKISGQERIIGKKAFAVLNLDQKAKIQMFMFEEGLEYASYNALVNFGEKGGDCDDWSKCKPNLDKFKDYVREEYEIVLKRLGTRPQEIENFTIDLEIENKSFIVSAINEEKLVFIKGGAIYKIDNGSYSKEINYDLNIYKELYNNYKGDKKSCSDYELKADMECDDSSDKIYIKFELKQNLLFVEPVIKFKVVRFGKLMRGK